MNRPRPFALIILDGWGYREDKKSNAIAHANKPNWDNLWENYPHTLISGCGKCVGLPADQMGNSEVGHLNMGAGRIVHQDLTKIDLSIEDGSFFKNEVFVNTIQTLKKTQKALHVLGLLSPGGVHSHERQIHALIELAKQQGLEKIYLHAFLDGRDTPPQSAQASLEKFKDTNIVSLIGRYYVMDRDKRWERVVKAYDLLTLGKADYHANDPITGLEMAYARGEADEFVKPTVIGDKPTVVENGDAIIFMNFRADRAREITRAFIDPDFTGFIREKMPVLSAFVSLTEYDATLKTTIAYPPDRLDEILGQYISELGLTQLRIAETEKYAHVTFFFNGGIEKPFAGEDRILIPSPKVATYDLKPEMSAYEVTDKLIEEIKNKKYDFIICNFANPDMVGHSGNFAAAVKAIECIDTCLGKIVSALQSVGGECLITADHGNAELMFDEKTGQPHTAHTHELVPLIYMGRKAAVIKQNGILSDVAPTMLYLTGLDKPKQMTGQTLFELK